MGLAQHNGGECGTDAAGATRRSPCNAGAAGRCSCAPPAQAPIYPAPLPHWPYLLALRVVGTGGRWRDATRAEHAVTAAATATDVATTRLRGAEADVVATGAGRGDVMATRAVGGV